MAEKATGIINGINTDVVRQVMKEVAADHSKGKVKFQVATTWTGQTRMETKVESYVIGGQKVVRSHKIVIDEPPELMGRDESANPQEMLMAAFNSCVMVGYTVGASMKGITLQKLVIETEGELDLRGFLGLDAKVKPGYDTIHYRVYIKGNGTEAQFQEIHEAVCATSPNRFNLAQPIKLDAKLIVEK